MAKTSPTARELAYLRERGITAQVTERWNPFARVRVDLFGCIDIVKLDGFITGVQVTSGTNHAARKTKAEAEPRVGEWIDSGGCFQIVSWSKKGPRGKRKVWTRRCELMLRHKDGGFQWAPE
jgi:hypothetical protein